jgi:N-carbamoylputrescine amidase
VSAVTVAVAQLAATPFDREANLALTEAAVRSAVDSGASLVVLPELVSTGYVMDGARLRDHAESFHAPGPILNGWSRMTRELQVTIVGGFAELDGDDLYNSVVVIGPDGLSHGLYRKLHLFGKEQGLFQPGNLGLPVVDVAGIRIGVLVCYDLRFPEAMRILALQGAQLIVVPTAWVSGYDADDQVGGRIGQVDGALVQANLNCVFLCCADHVGETDDTEFLGRSVIVDPFGRPLAGPLSPHDPDVAVARLDLDSLTESRHRGPGISPMADRRTDVYGELLGYEAAGRPLRVEPHPGRTLPGDVDQATVTAGLD